MKAQFRSNEFDAWQVKEHSTTADLPAWAKGYEVSMSLEENCIFLGGLGQALATTNDWLLHTNGVVLFVTGSEFERLCRVVNDEYPPSLIYEHVDDDRG